MVKKHITNLREVRAQQIGSMVTIRGIVTRASDVKPCIQVAVSACDLCGFEIYMIVQTKEFNPLVECPSEKCKKNNIKGQLQIQIKSSKFVSFQEIKIQEPSDQVPIGHVPRTLKVLAKGELTRKCSPGDIVTLTGVYLPQALYGFNKGGLF
jgi:DNA replication licensing factor MCM7